MTVRCLKCRNRVDKESALRRGISYVCLDCVQVPKTIDCYNDVVTDDNWACRACGTRFGGIQVHHIVYRSQGGQDVYDNLITLCQRCHALVHSSPREDYVPYFERIIELRKDGDRGTRVPDLRRKDVSRIPPE